MNGAKIPNPRGQVYVPNGTLISSHFPILDSEIWYKKKLQIALSAVDQVHGDGFWQPVRIDVSSEGENWIAGFKADTDRAWLFLHADQSATSLDLVHELGHGLEGYGFADLGIHPSAFAPEFEPWRRAVANSETFKTLVSMRTLKTRVFQSLVAKRSRVIDQENIKYLLEWHELFARAYAQYIALASGNKELRLHIANQSDSIFRQVLYPVQWSEQDFEFITEEIELLLLRRGWLK